MGRKQHKQPTLHAQVITKHVRLHYLRGYRLYSVFVDGHGFELGARQLSQMKQDSNNINQSPPPYHPRKQNAAAQHGALSFSFKVGGSRRFAWCAFTPLHDWPCTGSALGSAPMQRCIPLGPLPGQHHQDMTKAPSTHRYLPQSQGFPTNRFHHSLVHSRTK